MMKGTEVDRHKGTEVQIEFCVSKCGYKFKDAHVYICMCNNVTHYHNVILRSVCVNVNASKC